MALPSYLTRRNGIFHFRIVVPQHLRLALGRKVIKHTLHTYDPINAQLRALTLAVRYKQAFYGTGGVEEVAEDDDLLGKALGALQDGTGREYTLRKGKDGSLELSADGDKDHANLLELVKALGPDAFKPAPASSPSLPDVRSRLTKPEGVKSITVKRASEQYRKHLAHKFKSNAKTLQKNHKVLDDLEKHLRPMSLLHNSHAHDLAKFAGKELDKGYARSTVYSTMGWVAQFYDWAMTTGYYPNGNNPARGHVPYGAKDKRKSALKGWEAFSQEQLKTIFEADTFARLGNQRDRWVALIALYTGARSNEICLLELEDIKQLDGVWVFDFNLLGEFKSLKTHASERRTPIHPDLIRLGLLERVAGLRTQKAKHLFPDLNFKAQNGPANAPQRVFSRQLARLGIKARHGKVGLHSFRDTVISTMESHGVSQGWRERYCGHEQSETPSTLNTSHAVSYGSAAYEQIANQCHPALNWIDRGVVPQSIKSLL